MMIDDDNDDQMIFGDLGGLKLPDICLTCEEKPRKNLTHETCPDRGSNPGPLRDRRTCYHRLEPLNAKNYWENVSPVMGQVTQAARRLARGWTAGFYPGIGGLVIFFTLHNCNSCLGRVNIGHWSRNEWFLIIIMVNYIRGWLWANFSWHFSYSWGKP